MISFSVLSTILTYLTGIVILLKRLGSNSTLIVHFFTVYSIIWIFGGILLESYMQIAWGSITAAILLTLSEVFIYSYVVSFQTVKEKVTRNYKQVTFPYVTEMADELEVKI
ncbi:DUF2512 family protein [Bacillus coahuilensis]|uniref:DUF2512 family protein n=1 Tax=Bacillus coahuilensis TaxID=408580 RepID=UPI0009E7C85A|nr:DUF2512 family protein [Bacillus coahuilensis]